MKNNILLEELMNSPTVRNLGLKKEVVESLLDTQRKILLDNLLKSGHIYLFSGMNIEVVKILDRVHVLRGVTYKGNRKYKLKLTMEEDLYEEIESYYEKLKEDIL